MYGHPVSIADKNDSMHMSALCFAQFTKRKFLLRTPPLQLAEGIDGLVPVAVRVAVAGFTSSAWHVRNSSVMLYSAAVERAVGYNNRNAHEGERSTPTSSAGGGVTTTQFFSRFPQLHPLLLAGLRHCSAQAMATHGAGEWSREGQFRPSRAWHPFHHPSLHPLLLLLSRLRPEITAGHGLSAGLSVAPFIPFIRLAAVQRHMLVRRMAARALSALLPDEQVPVVVQSICAALQEAFVAHGFYSVATTAGAAIAASADVDVDVEHVAPTDPAVLLAPSALAAAVVPQSWNAVHGTLLQLTALLSRLAYPPPQGSITGWPIPELATARAAVLPALFALQQQAPCSPPSVVTGAAHAACAAFEVLGLGSLPQQKEKEHVSSGLSAELPGQLTLGGCLLAAEAGTSAVAVAMAALHAAMRTPQSDQQAAAVAAIAAAVSAADEDYATNAVRSLHACILAYADLTELWACPLGAEPSTTVVAQGLLAPLLALLGTAVPHPEAACVAAATVALLCAPMAAIAVQHSSAPTVASTAATRASGSRHAWAVLLRAHDSTRDGDLRGHCLRALAPMLACLQCGSAASAGSDAAETPARASAALPLLVERCLSAAAAVPSYALRLAAAAALRTCGALRPSAWLGTPTPSASCVRAWMTVLALLQDMDDEVRDAARAGVADAFAALLLVSSTASGALPAGMASVFERIERAWAALPPPLPLALPSAIATAAAAAAAAGGAHCVAATLSEGSALVLGHAMLALHAATGELSPENVLAALSDVIIAEAAALGRGAPSSSATLPSSADMLSRPLFTPDEDNDYTESLVAVFLAAVHCAAVLSAAGAALASPAAGRLAAAVVPRAAVLQGDVAGLSPSSLTLSVHIDRRDAWIGGTAWHPLRLRGSYAVAVGAAVPRLAALSAKGTGNATISSVRSPLTLREALVAALQSGIHGDES